MSKRAWGIILLIIVIALAAAWWYSQNTTAPVARLTTGEQPQCREINTRGEGWYDVNQKAVKYGKCSECDTPVCVAGSRWEATCNKGKDTVVIAFADCLAKPLPPSNTAPTCNTDASGVVGWGLRGKVDFPADCTYCRAEYRDTPQSGWYNSCTDQRIL